MKVTWKDGNTRLILYIWSILRVLLFRYRDDLLSHNYGIIIVMSTMMVLYQYSGDSETLLIHKNNELQNQLQYTKSMCLSHREGERTKGWRGEMWVEGTKWGHVFHSLNHSRCFRLDNVHHHHHHHQIIGSTSPVEQLPQRYKLPACTAQKSFIYYIFLELNLDLCCLHLKVVIFRVLRRVKHNHFV